ncbi:MAG: BamA/TamA family outer membrane protein [Chitinophagales bacterium]
MAQITDSKIPVKLIAIDGEDIPFAFKKYEKPIEKEELLYTTETLRNDLLTAGYATASIDKSYIKDDTAFINVFIGQRYSITNIIVADSNQFLLDEIGLKNALKKDIFLNQNALTVFQKGIIGKLERNGFPYAKVEFKEAVINGSDVELQLAIDKGPYITFDTVSNNNKAAISKGYLSTYLGIRAGNQYDESLVKNVDERLSELPFIQIQKPSRLWFSADNKAHVEVFLQEKKVSKFDFLIGVLPNNANSGKVLVTGEAGISLWNIFGTGKKIEVGWKRLQPQSQQLNIYFDYPYILNTPLGADVQFELDKQDTSFLDLQYAIGIQYLFSGRDRIKIIIDNNQTFLIQADTSFIKNTGKLPPVLDQSTFLTGLEVYFEKLNYIYNPQRGWELNASVTAGYKKVKKNTSILQLELPESLPTTAALYDSLAQRSAKFELKWLANYYIPIAKRQVIKVGASGGAIYNKSLLTNELLRIGGNDGLRGFDEESVFTSLYNIMTTEYRYLLDKNAYLSVFFDWAYVERRLEDSFSNDFPFGFGAGLNFETKAGIFGLSYALGRQNGNPIDFKSSKIHFGYVNIF